MAILCSLVNPINGVTVNPTTGLVSVDTALVPPGILYLELRKIDTLDASFQQIVPVELTVNAEGANIIAYQVTGIDKCNTGLSCIVDQTGQPYEPGIDVDNNPCLVIPQPKCVEYNSALGGSPPEDCCTSDLQIGSIAIDSNSGCVSQMCAGVKGWVPLCGGGTTALNVCCPEDFAFSGCETVCFRCDNGFQPESVRFSPDGGTTWETVVLDAFGCAEICVQEDEAPVQQGPEDSVIQPGECETLCYPCVDGDQPLTQTARYTLDGGLTWQTLTLDANSCVEICNGPSGCEIISQPSNVTGPAGTVINFGGSASTAVSWETSNTAFGPWTPANPPASIDASNTGTYWRFCCLDDPNVCSAVVQIVLTGNLSDQTVEVPDDGQALTTFCTTCPATWQVSIEDPDLEQFNDTTTEPPHGWQTITEAEGETCVEVLIDEEWPDGINPDPHDGEEFFLKIRASCDGGNTWDEAQLVMEL